MSDQGLGGIACDKGAAIAFTFENGTLELESATIEVGEAPKMIPDLVPEAISAELSPGGETASEEEDLMGGSPSAADGEPGCETKVPGKKPGSHPIRIYGEAYAAANGIRRIVLLEGHRYRWSVTFNNEEENPKVSPVTTSFDPSTTAPAEGGDKRSVSGFRFVQRDRPKRTKDGWSGAFCVRNYFGCAFLKIAGVGEVWFEIVPRKLDYLLHFRSMMADLSNRSEEMLLDWSAPATQPLASDPENEGVLIQQFNTLVNGIGPDALRHWLGAIKRNPHRTLESEARWQPAGTARLDAFVRAPLRHGRDWARVSSGGIASRGGNVTPQEILAFRRFDSFDTPPNRFVKFAIGQFAAVCRKVTGHFDNKRGSAKALQGKLWPAEIEAINLLDELESIRRDSFFEQVGDLRSLPLNNQTLQKRHGYRQMLKAWTRVRRATKFKWEAFEEEFFQGDSRDVPTLYEYWVFFQLREIIGGITGMAVLDGDGSDRDFLQESDDGTKLNLREGKQILCRYKWDTGLGNPLRLHLYFNRSFPASHSGPAETDSVDKIFSPGSYSRIFDPDYTLVIFPGRFALVEKTPDAQETEAAKAGEIAFLHFDAKYRVENFDAFTGGALAAQSRTNGDAVHDGSGAAQAEELLAKAKEAKAAENAVGFYKTGDLIKMHCYNEAIRRTRGSYVLFPGPPPAGAEEPDSGPPPEDATPPGRFYLYHELLPGVGAFRLLPKFVDPDGNGALTPGCDGAGELKTFLRDVLKNQEDGFTQRAAIERGTNDIIQERPNVRGPSWFSPSDGDNRTVDSLTLKGFIREAAKDACRDAKLFYCYARKGEEHFSLPDGVYEGMPFLPYSEEGWLGWKAFIGKITVVSKSELEGIFQSLNLPAPTLSAESYFKADINGIQDLNDEQASSLDKHPAEPHRPETVPWRNIFPPTTFETKRSASKKPHP